MTDRVDIVEMKSLAGKRLEIDSAGLTDIGLVRRKNEDSLFVLDSEEPNSFGAGSIGIYLVADGMGGHAGGEVASEMARQMISTSLLDSLKLTSVTCSPFHLIRESVVQAHKEILKAARSKPELRAMGTTVTVGLRLGLDLYIGHVGDSRAYLIRGGVIQRLTEDHSMVGRLLKSGTITSAQAKTHPDRGKILRSLGVAADVLVDTCVQDREESKVTLQAGDCLLFCSDGLTGCASDGEILDCAGEQYAPQDVCARLIGVANSRGGADNTSVIVVRVGA